ncbi:endonuclease/exonuclease/phosphatase family protein [Roseivivax halodurans]|uniref:endonuclease/exonuclease/phosphatase family protein n=1 Tax=Roseivivax halodurans TaxID=93683 RepID=UPI001FCB064B|nr:endonuclease/exonuclease/phosphatase family protein [Roseivivax halodurans]
MRVATWHADLTREGPGLLLRDLESGEEALDPILDAIVETAPDILLLTRVDWDHEGAALETLTEALETRGASFSHALALRPNTGLPTGVDVDGDGRLGTARDAQGYGTFSGQGGLALLSVYPIDAGAVTDLSGLLWRDLPGSLIAEDDPARDVQRLSSTAHWVVPIDAGGSANLTLLAFNASPPVFDGPEDRNGRRNADEIRLWQLLLDGALEASPPQGAPVVIGNANLDPVAGEGRHDAIVGLLADRRLRDPLDGIPSVDWSRLGLGELRVSYVLPGRDLDVLDAGSRAVDGSEHRIIWVDLSIPD